MPVPTGKGNFMKIIGVDPGTWATGFGVIIKEARGLVPLAFGEITIAKNTPISKALAHLSSEMSSLLETMAIEVMALENIFLGKSIRSLVTQAHTRGVLILCAQQKGIPVFEYSPLEIKKAVVGYGRAEKQQVQAMVSTILKIEAKMSFDASDALALAICHAHSQQGRRL